MSRETLAIDHLRAEVSARRWYGDPGALEYSSALWLVLIQIGRHAHVEKVCWWRLRSKADPKRRSRETSEQLLGFQRGRRASLDWWRS